MHIQNQIFLNTINKIKSLFLKSPFQFYPTIYL